MKFSGFSDIVKFAIQRKEEAANGYDPPLKMATDEGARRLLQDLRQEEQKKLFEFLAKQEKSQKLRLELEYDKYILSED
jgi:rubrerythrin